MNLNSIKQHVAFQEFLLLYALKIKIFLFLFLRNQALYLTIVASDPAGFTASESLIIEVDASFIYVI